MDEAEFTRHVASALKDFPPNGHKLERIEFNGRTASLHIAPRPGFTGEPKALVIPVGETFDDVLLAMMHIGFMQRQYGKAIPETRP